MTKKQNTLVFMLISTLANILMTCVLIALFGLIAIFFLKDKALEILPFVLIAAIIVEFLIYQQIIKIVFVKFKLEEKLDPLFSRKRR
ncbi:MAG: hypothetical protein Ta2A_06720 [Treponemataceae bacterium]|nr:MAG: hypothetical protein Ta2A_06720 [Treponemataceae bacterium]